MQEAYVTLRAICPTAPEHDLMLKVQGESWSAGHIEVRFDETQGQIAVGTWAPSQGWVDWGPALPTAFAAGDRLGARAYADGTVEVFRNSTLLGSVSVAGWPFAALGGRIGLTLAGASTSRLDDFGGGSVSPPEPQTAAPSPRDASGSTVSGEAFLSAPYPNPSRGSGTTVEFGLRHAGQVTLKVYDIGGREVRRLL